MPKVLHKEKATVVAFSQIHIVKTNVIP